MFLEKRMNTFLLSTDPKKIQIDRVHRYLSEESYWCVKIPKKTVIKAIENSLCFSVFQVDQNDQLLQVAFCRVVTDFATFGWVCDVYVEKEFRGFGLSKWMVKEIVDHPDLQGLRRLCLATVSAHKLYEKYGFKVTQTPGSWMEIKDNDIYLKSK